MNVANTEYQVLETLWREAPLTIGQIIARVQPATGWHQNTIKTLVTRLYKKELVQRVKDGKQYFYSPTVAREDVISEASESLLGRFFDGKLAPLVAHFADQKKINQAELDEITAILEDMKKHD